MRSRLELVSHDQLRNNRTWHLGLGTAHMILGGIAVVSASALTIDLIVVYGWLLVVGGAMQVFHAYRQTLWRGFLTDLIGASLYAAVGIMIIVDPRASMVAMTFLIATFLFAQGVFRVVVAAVVDVANWDWVLLQGVVAVVLGIAVWQQWPLSDLWALGLYVGIELLLNGFVLVMFGLAAQPATSAVGNH